MDRNKMLIIDDVPHRMTDEDWRRLEGRRLTQPHGKRIEAIYKEYIALHEASRVWLMERNDKFAHMDVAHTMLALRPWLDYRKKLMAHYLQWERQMCEKEKQQFSELEKSVYHNIFVLLAL